MTNEYIRRQDAIIEMMDNDVDHAQGTDGREVVQILSDIPAADVAPVVHGEWVWKPTKQYCPPDCWYPPINHEETWNEKDGTWLENEMYCSKCGYHNFREVKFNFCPNCGAKMDGEE